MNYQCKCGSMDMFTEKHGNNVGLYCSSCGKWIKWLNKDELRAFEKNKVDKKSTKKYTDNIIERLENFIKGLDDTIDREMDKFPLSNEDAIRKSSYCLALERCKTSIYNIIDGKEWNEEE